MNSGDADDFEFPIKCIKSRNSLKTDCQYTNILKSNGTFTFFKNNQINLILASYSGMSVKMELLWLR